MSFLSCLPCFGKSDDYFGGTAYSPLAQSPDISDYTRPDYRVHTIKVDSLQGEWKKFPFIQTLASTAFDEEKNRIVAFGKTEANQDIDGDGERDSVYAVQIDVKKKFPISPVHTTNPPSDSRVGHTVVLKNGVLYSIGGSRWDGKQLDDAFISVDLSKGLWTSMRSFWRDEYNGDMANHSCCVQDDKVIIFGGRIGEKCVKLLSFYDFNVSEWRSAEASGFPPCERQLHSACIHDNLMYVFGGIDDNLGCYNDLHCYNTEANTWNRIHTSGIRPSPRNAHGCVVWNGSMIVFGGRGFDRKPLNDCYSLDLATYEWNEVRMMGEVPSEVYKHSMVQVSDNSIVVMGGKPYSTSVFIYLLELSPNFY